MKKLLILFLARLMLAAIPAQMTSCALNVKASELSAGYTRTATDEGEVTDAFIAAMAPA